MHELVDRMDEHGRAAWIGLMVLSFILFWPLGLGLLAFLLWSGRMGCGGRHRAWSGEDRRARFERKMTRLRERFADMGGGETRGFALSGNRAFDEYRQDMLKRLEDEATDFRSFLDRLRHAKDKAEFDQFMADRRSRPAGPAQSGEGNLQPPPSA